MGINIVVTSKKVGADTYELDFGHGKTAVIRKRAPGEQAPTEPTEETVATTRRWRYVHRGTCQDGPCARCAAWVGVEFDWDGETTVSQSSHGWTYKATPDGVPVEPMHPYCDCFVSPVDADDVMPAGEHAEHEVTNADRFAYLESLSDTELRGILGDVRAKLIRDKIATIEEFYDEEYNLIPLSDLGYSTKGIPVMPDGVTPRKSKQLVFRRF